MKSAILTISTISLVFSLGGCGLGVSQLPEVWDRSDPEATAHMEMQVKRAIYCELKVGAKGARASNSSEYFYNQKNITTSSDAPLPDTWGAQVTLTITADEKSTLTPGVSFKTPLPSAITNFVGAAATTTTQSFSTGIGGTLSSQNVHYDKFDFYYSASDLLEPDSPDDVCHKDLTPLIGTASTSSPFVDASKLGIREWLPGAIAVVDFKRSSRAAADGEGAPLGVNSDSATYDNKFVIISSANVTPTWNLIRVSTPATSLFDMNRTRTHELLITIGPGISQRTVDKKTGKKQLVNVAPSETALYSHLASQIGSAVANAIRGQ